jgi:hypothetical protein
MVLQASLPLPDIQRCGVQLWLLRHRNACNAGEPALSRAAMFKPPKLRCSVFSVHILWSGC